MRPDTPAVNDLSHAADSSVTQTEPVSDREFFHRFISADQAEPGPEPAFVLFHDSGGNEEDLLAIVEAGAEHGKANVIALRGLFEYEPGYSFLGTPAEFAATAPNYIARADRISEFLAWAAKEYNLDPAKVVIFGAGDGATLALTLLFVHSELLGGAVLIRPKSPYRPKPLPALPCYPILMLNPKNESSEEKAAAENVAETLFDCGCSVRKVKVPANAHFEDKVIKAIRAWYKKVAATDISIECAL
jgi:phospholipase/carboxylesterase